MIAIEETARVATDAALLRLGRDNVVTAISEPTANSRGEDALRVTVVITPDAMDRLQGDAFLSFLAEISDRLQAAGEDRFPIVHYATEDELRDDEDLEI